MNRKKWLVSIFLFLSCILLFTSCPSNSYANQIKNVPVAKAKIVLKQGSSGSRVTDIQKRLDVLGYNIPLTGIYDKSTFNAVADFQKKNSLEVSGNIDESTYKKLSEIKLLYLGPPKLKTTQNDTKDSISRQEFINRNNYSSYTEYFIWVNKGTFVVDIFKGKKGNWELEREFPCTIGKGGIYETPTGIFQSGEKGKFFLSKYNVSAKYYTHINEHVLFHTIIFDSEGKKIVDSRLKMRLSHGCIRLAIPDAKYIYDNIPQGTTIYIN